MKFITRKNFSKRKASLIASSLPIALLSASINAAEISPIQGFTLTPLETPSGFVGGASNRAYDINDNGVVVGSSRKSIDSVNRAVLWDSAGIGGELLGHGGSSDNNGLAKAINNSGQAVGSADGPATIWLDGINSAGTDLYSQLGGGANLKDINDYGFSISKGIILDNNLEPTLLSGITEALGSPLSETIAINNNNSIIGTVDIPESRYIVTPVINPVLIEGNSYSLLGTLSEFEGGDARPSDINDLDQIVGVAYEPNVGDGELNSRAVIWQNDLIASLGTLGGNKSNAVKINNRGQIIGNTTDADNNNHAFIWQNDVMYDLSPALCNQPNSCTTIALAINNNNEIVASVYESSTYELVKFSFQEAAVGKLPSVYSPLNFVTPTGVESGSGNNTEGADISVSLRKPTVKRLNNRNFEVRYHSLFKNAGPQLARNLVSTFTVSGKLNLIKVFTNAGSCETEASGTKKDRTVTVICQHGDINPDQILSRTVVVKAKRLRRLIAIDTIESETTDPDTRNNSIKLKGVK